MSAKCISAVPRQGRPGGGHKQSIIHTIHYGFGIGLSGQQAREREQCSVATAGGAVERASASTINKVVIQYRTTTQLSQQHNTTQQHSTESAEQSNATQHAAGVGRRFHTAPTMAQRAREQRESTSRHFKSVHG